MEQYMDSLYANERVMNLTTSLLQDIHTFDVQDPTKLKEWLSYIEMAVDILKGSHACLVEAKSCGLANTLFAKHFKVEKAGIT